MNDYADAVAYVERLRAALQALVNDVLEYERINNLAPNPGRDCCWDSVSEAVKILSEDAGGPT